MRSGGGFYVIGAEFDLPAVTVENYESVVPLFLCLTKRKPPSRNAQKMLYLTCYCIFIFYTAGLLFHSYLKQRKYIKSKDFKAPRHCAKLSGQLRNRAVLSLKRIDLNFMQAPKALEKFAYEHFLSVLSKVEIHLQQAERDEALVQ